MAMGWNRPISSSLLFPSDTITRKRVFRNLRERTAPPCRGAGPTGLRGFTPTDTHIKYVFVDVRPLRRFAPPPLQGGGVYFATPTFALSSIAIQARQALTLLHNCSRRFRTHQIRQMTPVSGLETGCSRPLKLGVPGLWNWVFQALELSVPGLETGCSRP